MGSGVLLAALVVLWFVVLVPMVVTRGDSLPARAGLADSGRTLQRRRAVDPAVHAETERVSIDRAAAGRGMASLAVALVCDHVFGAARLHRLQADIRPENGPSQRLVERLGFRYEGLLRRYLDIDGDWRDHRSYALLAEDLPAGVLDLWRARIPR